MKKITTEEFINKSKTIHNDLYDYSLVEFVNVKINVKILCFEHGEFEQRPQHHMAGHGCWKCARKSIGKSSRLTENQFIFKAKEVHGKKYNYSLIEYNNVISNNDKINIICPSHGEFNQIIRHHLSGSGCPHGKESKGEKEIAKYLNDNNIKFFRQYRFADCKLNKPLPFDFYLPDFNICIEYQGEQHFAPVDIWGGETGFKKVVKRDKIKKEFCKERDIKLLEISYKNDVIQSLNSGL